MRRRTMRLAAVLAAGLLVAACGDADDTGDDDAIATATTTESAPAGDDDMEMDDETPMDDDMDMGDTGMSGDYGEPASASDADRTIEVAVDNDLAFTPEAYDVAAGEVVTFRIANTGDIEHEFVLGDEEAQEQMAEDMAGDDVHAHSGDMTNAVTIHPGEQAELTWRFPEEPTTVLVGCHVPGHWEAGMRGLVTVG